MPGLAKEKVSLPTTIPVGPPSSGTHAQPCPTVSPSQGSQPHLPNPVNSNCGPRGRVPVALQNLGPNAQQQRLGPIMEPGRAPMPHSQSMAPTTGSAPVSVGPSECSNMPTPPNMVPIGPSSGPPAGPPPGPIMGPVHMNISSAPQQPVQPQMATHITQPSASKCFVYRF